MRGLIGDRFLRRFAGHIRERLGTIQTPESDWDLDEGTMITKRTSDMSVFIANLEQTSIENIYFRRVLFTGPKSQLVLMALQPGEDIGLETHPNTDQFIHVESGQGRAVIGGQGYDLEAGSTVLIPAGKEHNVINPLKETILRLYTIYTPPAHPDGTIHKTKAEAQAAHHHASEV